MLEEQSLPVKLIMLGFILVIVGFALAFAGIIGRLSRGEVSATGIVLIGPIPIVWGFGPKAYELTILGLVILVIVLLLIFYFSKIVRE